MNLEGVQMGGRVVGWAEQAERQGERGRKESRRGSGRLWVNGKMGGREHMRKQLYQLRSTTLPYSNL